MMQQSQETLINENILTNLVFIKKLGEGQFGKVILVKDKETNEYFALKCISKRHKYYEQIKKTIDVIFI